MYSEQECKGFDALYEIADRTAKLWLSEQEYNKKIKSKGNLTFSFAMTIEKERKENDDVEEETIHPPVPPKFLLLYLARKGILTYKNSVPGEDIQDDDLIIPDDLNNKDLLEWTRSHLTSWPPLLTREYKEAPACMASSSFDRRQNPSFRIMTWNILADALGSYADCLVKCPSEALIWKNRRFKIIEEILTYEPDIICLQEVDHFKLLEKILKTQGYSGVFFPKPDSPCIYFPGNNGPDGCALFYKSNKFSLQSLDTRILEVWHHVQSNQVAIMAIFEDLISGKEFVVMTTHLKAIKGAFLSTYRNEQGNDLLSFVGDHCEGRPTIICGDFNAEQTEPVYETMTRKYESAYAQLYGGRGEPPYSTWKIRKDGEQKHTIDYIFYTESNLALKGGLNYPTEEQIGKDRLPSYQYPSDHFSLICDFSFKRRLQQEESMRGRL